MMDWTCPITAEDLELLKSWVPLCLEAQRAQFAKHRVEQDFDESWFEAMAAHDALDEYLLGRWAETVTHDGEKATATVDWADAPTEEEWTGPEQEDRFWRALREVALSRMNSERSIIAASGGFREEFDEALAMSRVITNGFEKALAVLRALDEED